MPELFKLLARNLIIGIAAGWITLALLIVTDTGGLGYLVLGSANPVIPLFLLMGGFAITFGSISMGAAIMTLPYDGKDGRNNGLKVMTLMASWVTKLSQPPADEGALAPVPVKGKTRRDKRHY